MERIGVGLITCDRENFFIKCFESVHKLKHKFDFLVVVNDGDAIDTDSIDNFDCIDVYHHNEQNQGVGVSKNIAIEHILQASCDHVFLIEDDVVLHDPEVFNRYINMSKISGIKHLNFCLHGNDNKIDGSPAPKLIIDYKHDKLALYHNLYGALSYYHKDVIDSIGLMDTTYRNAMEHVDHTMLACQSKFHPPFRWFADIAGSDQLIHEQDQGHEQSKIRSRQQWLEDFAFGVKRFYDKFDVNVCDPTQKTADKQQVVEFLKEIKP